MTEAGRARVDVAVAGAGIAGLATALGLVSGVAGPMPRVLLCDPALGAPTPPRGLRAVALAEAPRRFLERLGVWDRVSPRAQPITAMTLGDTTPGAVPVPTLLTFAATDGDGPLAHMVFQDDLRDALIDACRTRGVAFDAASITEPVFRADGVALRQGPGAPVARLLVAADGARSRLRARARLRTLGWDYDQAAIVATLSHTADHGGEAIQAFMPGGPLAFLPLRAPDGTGRWTSIVWSERRPEAERLAALPADAFCAALLDRGGLPRGTLELLDRPRVVPLALRMARDLAGPRMALVGDAARVIHPLAGQGLNLGLGDAEALARLAGEALGLGLDPGAPRVLDGYTRARRADQLAVVAATDGLNRLFSNNNAALRLLRDVGLGLVDRWPAAKAALARRAAG